MRLAISLTSSECRVAENIMTCSGLQSSQPTCEQSCCFVVRIVCLVYRRIPHHDINRGTAEQLLTEVQILHCHTHCSDILSDTLTSQ